MNININISNLASISEANQDFAKTARMMDQNGAVVILKNNKPPYVLIEYSQLYKEELIDDMEVEDVVKNISSRYMRAFEELAK